MTWKTIQRIYNVFHILFAIIIIIIIKRNSTWFWRSNGAISKGQKDIVLTYIHNLGWSIDSWYDFLYVKSINIYIGPVCLLVSSFFL
jgi:hypothetical protein